MRAWSSSLVFALSARGWIAASALLPWAALAQDSSQKAPDASAAPACWQIVSGVEKVAPNGAILLNRCNGATWVLARTTTSAATAKTLEEYTYRWYPISLENKEAILTNIVPPPKSQ